MAARREPSEPTRQQPFPLPLENAPNPGATRLRPYTDLFLISFTILFFELACIRYFASSVIFLTFFTNIVLMACFLGMSIGLLTAARKRNFIRMVIPLCLVAVSAAWLVLWAYEHFAHVVVDVGSQNSPQQIY